MDKRPRGRPPHPDILTPREWEVLLLLRHALSNEEIAERLGISVPGVKYHVSQILSKLHVSSREEAAAWQPEKERRRTAWPALPLAAKAAAVTVIAAAVAALAVLATGIAFTGNDDDGPDFVGDGPTIGTGHWRAKYDIWICGERQPDLVAWTGGVTTYGDGFIHVHPQIPSEEGTGAALGRFFEYGGGLLSEDTLRLPGSADFLRNGEQCPSGDESFVRVYVNGEIVHDYVHYVPQDGDHIVISFGPRDENVAGPGIQWDCPPDQSCPAPLIWRPTDDYAMAYDGIGLAVMGFAINLDRARIIYILTTKEGGSVEPGQVKLSGETGTAIPVTGNVAIGSSESVSAYLMDADASTVHARHLTLTVTGASVTTAGSTRQVDGAWAVGFIDNQYPEWGPGYSAGGRVAPDVFTMPGGGPSIATISMPNGPYLGYLVNNDGRLGGIYSFLADGVPNPIDPIDLPANPPVPEGFEMVQPTLD